MRVLVAFGADHRSYGDAIVGTIEVLRSGVRARTAGLDGLAEEVERFDPDLVVCSRPNAVGPGNAPAWVELSLDPLRPTSICVGGRRSRLTNPTLEALLAVVDEVEELIRTNDDPRGC